MLNINSIEPTRRRRAEIRRLAARGPIASQEALARLLRRRGWRVTQPTLSRDLRALGLVRTPAGYVLPGAAGPGPARTDLARALAEFALSVTPAGSLVVIRTPPAGADPLARALDEAALGEVVGTIAGDDTVFVATPGPAAARRLAARLVR